MKEFVKTSDYNSSFHSVPDLYCGSDSELPGSIPGQTIWDLMEKWHGTGLSPSCSAVPLQNFPNGYISKALCSSFFCTVNLLHLYRQWNSL